MRTHKYNLQPAGLDNAYQIIYSELQPLLDIIKGKEWQVVLYQSIHGCASNPKGIRWDKENLPNIIISVGQHHKYPIMHTDDYPNSVYTCPISPNAHPTNIRDDVRDFIQQAVRWVQQKMRADNVTDHSFASHGRTASTGHSVIRDAD